MEGQQLNYLDCSRKAAIVQQIKPILDRYDINRDFISCIGPTLNITGVYRHASFSVDYFTGEVTIDSNDLFTDAEAEEIRQEIAKYTTLDPRSAMGFPEVAVAAPILAGGVRSRKRRLLRSRKQRSKQKTLRKRKY